MSPLRGVKVIELAGLAPSPFCGMILADFGAAVTVVNRTQPTYQPDVLGRGKRSIALDLKRPEGVDALRRMCAGADVLIEPFRAGVMEKMNLGPEALMKENPGLIYARLTGYGQHGPYARKAGHDINYLAISGLLSVLGRKSENPTPPINLLADFGGGGLTCALGVMAALLQRHQTGRGQVVDSNMVEGAAYLGSWIFKAQDTFIFGKPRGNNILDSGAHYYDTYETKDGKHVAVGSIEPNFYEKLLEGLSLTADDLPQFGEPDEMKRKLADVFRTKTRDEWASIFDAIDDSCVTPVLGMEEAVNFKHNATRGSFAKSHGGNYDPIPAPRLSDMPDPGSIVSRRHPEQGEHTREILAEAGFTSDETENLLESGVAGCSGDTKSKL